MILAFLSGTAIGQENASNPLAAVDNPDVRLQYFDLGEASERYDLWADGAQMLQPNQAQGTNVELSTEWSTTPSFSNAFNSIHFVTAGCGLGCHVLNQFLPLRFRYRFFQQHVVRQSSLPTMFHGAAIRAELNIQVNRGIPVGQPIFREGSLSCCFTSQYF